MKLNHLSVVIAGLLLLGGVATVACKPPLCDHELKLDKTYVATISELYNQQSVAAYNLQYDLRLAAPWPSCKGWDGLIADAKIAIVTNQTQPAGACDLLEGEITTLPNNIQWQQDISALIQGAFDQYSIFTAIGRVTTGPCRGSYKVAFERPRTNQSVFSETKPGEVPNLVIGRTFSPEASDSAPVCPPCADAFVARLAVGK